mgnify:CR=1 FL=1
MTCLKERFGPTKHEVWQQFCSEIASDIVQCYIWQGEKLVIKQNQWMIILDTYNRQLATHNGIVNYTYTRISSPYTNPDEFHFAIYRKGLYKNLGKFFGMENIRLGNAWLDEHFSIETNNYHKARQLFANPKIIKLMQLQTTSHWYSKNDEGWFGTCFAEGIDELYFQTHGIIKNVERLKALFELFAQTLNYISHGESLKKEINRVVVGKNC